MRFAYIDSQGNEVSIPSVDALALRIELGAIGPDTDLYDAQADRWGPAHTHEIFHTLSRAAGDEGFVAPPPPVAPPPAAGSPAVDEAEAPAAEEPEPAAESPAEEAPAEVTAGGEQAPAWNVSDELGLAPPESEAEDAAPEGESLADDFGLTLADAQPADEAPVEAEAPAADDLGGFGDLSLDLAAPADEAPAPMEAAPEEPVADDGEAFDFGGFDGSLEGVEPEPPAAATPAASMDDAPMDMGGGLDLESPMDFAGGGDDASGGLDLETPMSEFTPEAPPAWMEQEGPGGDDDSDGAMSFGAPALEEEEEAPPARAAAPADDADEPRERPEPRSRPSPPRRKKKAPVGTIAMAVVGLAVIGGGGYFVWSTFLAGGGGADEEGPVALPPVIIPDIPAELLPQMRDMAEAALAEMLEDLRSRSAALDIPLEPNPDWLSGRYLANASQFADIEEFWVGIERFLDEVRATDTQLFHEKYVEQVEAGGFAADTAAMLVERADSGFLAARDDRIVAYNLMDDLVNAALDLHLFLLDNELEIEYQPAASGLSADPVLEAVPSSEAIEEEMLGLVAEITRALADLGTLDRVTTERLFAVLFDRIRRAGIE